MFNLDDIIAKNDNTDWSLDHQDQEKLIIYLTQFNKTTT